MAYNNVFIWVFVHLSCGLVFSCLHALTPLVWSKAWNLVKWHLKNTAWKFGCLFLYQTCINISTHFKLCVCLTSERRLKRRESARRPTVSDDKIQEASADCYIFIYIGKLRTQWKCTLPVLGAICILSFQQDDKCRWRTLFTEEVMTVIILRLFNTLVLIKI